MAKGNMLLGMARKKVGDLVFYRSNGEQITRARNRNPRNPKSDKQSVQRMILATASKTAAILRPLINHSWEGVQIGADSIRHFQKKAMDIFRANAAYVINGGDDPAKAVFVIKGAPIPGVVDGLPISSGNLTLNAINVGDSVLTLRLSSALSEGFTTQEGYAAELAKLGLEPGDQLTIVIMAQNPNQAVASYGSETNYATLVRYARVVFKPVLPEGFDDILIDGTEFNPLLIEKTEGIWPATQEVSGVGQVKLLQFDTEIGDFSGIAATLIRSQRDASGKVHYNPAIFHVDATNLDTNNAADVWPSYGENVEGVNVGDELYLQNAVAAPLA